MWWILILILLCILTKIHYWYIKGIPCILPLPIIGNSLSLFYTSMINHFDWIYNYFDSPYCGFWLFTRPILLLKDPELIQNILIKNQDFFTSHGMLIDKKNDPMGGSVFHLESNEWKLARNKITPNLTLSKINNIFDISKQSDIKLIQSLNNINQIEIKNQLLKYTTDKMFNGLFGLQTDAFENDSKFDKLSQKIFINNSSYIALLSILSPKIFNLCRFTSFSKWCNDFLIKIFNDILKLDDLNQNFIQNLKNNKNRDYNDDFIISQSFVMFVGSVETTASTLAFCLYELALKPELQEKARNEALGYEEPGFIDMTILETLRKYPIFCLLTRGCTKDYKIPDTNVTINKGTFIMIPAYSIHHDPKHFEQPEEFIPERFAPDTKQGIKPGTYMPFGMGQRTCIGKKIALLSLNRCLSQLLREYKFSPCSQTEIPLKLSPNTFFTSPQNGIYLKINHV